MILMGYFFSYFLSKSICCGYTFELPGHVEAVQMNVFYSEIDKSEDFEIP